MRLSSCGAPGPGGPHRMNHTGSGGGLWRGSPNPPPPPRRDSLIDGVGKNGGVRPGPLMPVVWLGAGVHRRQLTAYKKGLSRLHLKHVRLLWKQVFDTVRAPGGSCLNVMFSFWVRCPSVSLQRLDAGPTQPPPSLSVGGDRPELLGIPSGLGSSISVHPLQNLPHVLLHFAEVHPLPPAGLLLPPPLQVPEEHLGGSTAAPRWAHNQGRSYGWAWGGHRPTQIDRGPTQSDSWKKYIFSHTYVYSWINFEFKIFTVATKNQ